MILSGKEIKKELNKNIFIEPFDENKINPNSYNLSLHNELMIYSNDTLNMKKNHKTKSGPSGPIRWIKSIQKKTSVL